jgi:hypothetical protein
MRERDLKQCSTGRRRFLQVSAAATAAGVLAGCLGNDNNDEETFDPSSSGWTQGMQINPQIDNLRVVMAYDPAMVSADPNGSSIEAQNDVINGGQVESNLDKMAIALAQKSTAAESWSTIFQKPAGKDWADVKCAFKVNCLAPGDVPRLAVLGKVAKELNALGVPYGSITIYDGGSPNCTNAYDTNNSTYSKDKLPAGIHFSDDLGGSDAEVILQDGKKEKCLKALAEGTIDILVNFAVNKGHSISQTGGYTLTLKNHIGTMKFGHDPLDEFTDKIIAINQSQQILGSGTVARQQLCVVDSLWGMTRGPAADLDKRTYCLVMGTCSPIVDYLTVKHIRESDNADYGMNLSPPPTRLLHKRAMIFFRPLAMIRHPVKSPGWT